MPDFSTPFDRLQFTLVYSANTRTLPPMPDGTLKENLMGATVTEMEDLMVSLGQKRYKGRQLFKWLYSVRQYDFRLMTDLTKDLRAELNNKYRFEPPTLEHEAVANDGTRKFLFRLDDNHRIEAVLIPEEEKRRTACVSSQSGCGLGCRFCATASLGLARSLSIGEIIGQLIHMRDQCGDDAFTNVVFMGMGEPLLNLDNVIGAIRIMRDSVGLGLAAKKITISTVGIPAMILKLADTGLKSRLAVSLNAATQEKREEIMPVARRFTLDLLTEALRYFTNRTSQRVTFEYVLFSGFNDTPADVKALEQLVRGIPCKINLLAYNPVEGLHYQRPSEEDVDRFARALYPRVPAVTVRKSRGMDIAAACGQLAAKGKNGRSLE